MITIGAVLARLPGLDAQRVQVWIEHEWVRPGRRGGEPVFAEIDVARLRLIGELEAMDVGEGAMPVVLSLLDQLHEQRRQMRRLVGALDDGTVRRISERRGS